MACKRVETFCVKYVENYIECQPDAIQEGVNRMVAQKIITSITNNNNNNTVFAELQYRKHTGK